MLILIVQIGLGLRSYRQKHIQILLKEGAFQITNIDI